jgi:hypothetical protein
MTLSTRTYQRERMWVALLRNLPEGANNLPLKMELMHYQALKNTCVRLNKIEGDYNFVPSIRKGKVTVVKSRRTSYGESIGEQLQSEQAL